MAKAMARFAAVEIERLAKRAGPKTVMHHDGGGLYLTVDSRGASDDRLPSASWVFRYMLDGKARSMGLGSYPAVGLAKARQRAAAAREARANGDDPLDQRDAERAAKRQAKAMAMTFKEAAEAYIESKRDGWKVGKNADLWTASLTAYVFPIIGASSVQDVDNAAVLGVLQQEVTKGEGKPERLWSAIPTTASKLRGRMEAILSWAAAGGRRTGENPASWDILKHQLPAKSALPRGKVKHHPALAIDAMPHFMARLRVAEGMGARALEFVILTAARSGEVRGAKWGEIDLVAEVWTVPAERMKAGREHRVPLSKAALALLEQLSPGEAGDLVFPAVRGGPLSDMTLSAVLRRMMVEAVPHGFRSTFRDWGGERTNFPSEMLELALAHNVGDETERAYRRGTMFEKRLALMNAWAGFIG